MTETKKKFQWIRYPGQGRGVALGLLVCLVFGAALENPAAGILFGVILGGGIEASAFRKERRRRRHELKRERAEKAAAKKEAAEPGDVNSEAVNSNAAGTENKES